MKTKNKISKALVPTILILLFFIVLSSANAVDVTLNPGDAGGVNSAVSTVASGSDVNNTITLNPGTYNKNTDRNNNITFSGKNLTIQGNGSTGSVIIDAQKSGRLFNITGNSNITFINITFLNGNITGAGSGGAIYNTGGKLSVINCTFNNNTATSNGGAIYNSIDNMTVINSNFYNNSCSQSGGAIYNAGQNLSVNNSNFLNNRASLYGGAIFIATGSNYSTIYNCTFTNDTSNADGGAIYTIGSHNVSVITSNFSNNTAAGNGGGALYNTGGDNLTVINSTFTNNTSIGFYGGGAIVNSYENAPGLPHGDYFTVINCTFINNRANNTNQNNVGGAITNIYGDYASIINSTFINNTAYLYGGAIYNSGGLNFSVSNSSFTNNKATSISGGAITNAAGVNFTVSNSNFTNNSAGQDGGAILNGGLSTMNVSNSNFINNVADNRGGSIYNSGNMSVSKNFMSGNVAALGQMIYNNGNMGILNLTYLNNETVIVDNGTVVLLNATLTDDMGNTVTGQNISFYVNGTFIGNQTATEGQAQIPYLVNHGIGTVTVTGDYAGHQGFNIIIKDGQLLIVTETNVIGTINLDKDEYKVNETVKGTINVINNGPDTAYNVTVKVNLPPEFILNESSVVVSQGYFDPLTNIWHVGNLTAGEEATMNFTGHFTKPGTYTLDIVTSGTNFDTTTDSATAIVEEPEPPEPPVPPEPPEPPEPSEPNNNKTTNNPTANATMKPTGLPINILLAVLLSILGFGYYRKQ
jgi:predicted outer membrane repeat protein